MASALKMTAKRRPITTGSSSPSPDHHGAGCTTLLEVQSAPAAWLLVEHQRSGMSIAARFFAKPDGVLVPLKVTPRLASWMPAARPEQTRLSEFLDHAESLVMPILANVPDSLALRLDVGLPPGVALLGDHDLTTTSCHLPPD